MIIQNIHRLFYFLNTNEGTLFKYFLELTLFAIISYMIISEFRRTREPEMKYLAYGFGFLTFEKAIIAMYLWYYVFGNQVLYIMKSKLPLIANSLEIVALVFFSNAFLKKIQEPQFQEN